VRSPVRRSVRTWSSPPTRCSGRLRTSFRPWLGRPPA
jgi:hypothetical protein